MRTLAILVLLIAAAGQAAGAQPSQDDPAADFDVGEDGAGDGSSGDEYTTVVSATEPAGKDPSADGVEVDGEDLRESPRPSLFEAISQQVAGVYVTGKGVGPHGVASGASGSIAMRGLGGSPNTQVLVVENGVPDFQGIFGHPIPDAYVPFLIDDVLVIKGGDSVLYGTNAMGGVIVIRDRFLGRDGLELSTDLSAGSFETLAASAALLAAKGKWDLASSFGFLTTEGHRDGAGGTSAVGQAGGRWRPAGDLELEIRVKVAHVDGGDPGPVTHPYTDHWFDVWRVTVSMGLGWERGILGLRVVPFANIGAHELYDGFHSLDVVAGGTVEADVRILESLGLLLGLGVDCVDGTVEDVASGERTEPDAAAGLSFYNQFSYHPVPGLALVAGSREMFSTRYGFVLLFKGGAAWTLPGGFTIRARIARNFRQPTIRELYLPYPTANPDLKPEYALNLDLGVGFHRDHLEASVTWYRTAAKDMIRYFGSWPSAEVVNIDHMVVYGIEASLDLADLGPIGIHVGADWQDVGRFTRQNPSSKYDFAVLAGHGFGRHGFEASISGEWVRGLYAGNYGRDPMEDAFFLDLGFRYRIAIEGSPVALEPYLYLRNLTDNRFAYIDQYVMPGFNLAAGLRVSI